jgi:AraC-like DNA-binding protein
MITLEYRVPPDDLQPYVTLFYHFRADVPVFDDVERADHAQLRFQLSDDPASYSMARRRPQQAAACHVIGPTSGAFRSSATGPVELVGMGLHPAGWLALVRLDASALLDRTTDAAPLLGEEATTAALEEMRAAEGTDAKVAVAQALVRRSIARDDKAGPLAFARAIDAWLSAAAPPELAALADATDLSQRQVERRVKALYGVPPKALARKYRALRAAVALAQGAAMRDALTAGGFYDQSHLIRELKQFTGMTPGQLRDAPALLSQLTITRRRALHGQVHPIISDT